MDDGRSILRSRRGVVVAYLLFTAASLLFIVGLLWPTAGEITNGFASYYTASTLVREGVDVVEFYDNRWFMDQTIRVGFADAPDVFWVNPPPVALLFYPLAMFEIERADILWNVVNTALLLASTAVLIKTLRDAEIVGRDNRVMPALLIALTLVYNPVWRNIEQGQAYILLLLGMCLAFRAYVLDQRRAGVWLGLLLVIKAAGGLIWVALLIDRRWKTLAYGAATVLGVIVVSAFALGLDAWGEYVLWIPSLFDQGWTGVTAYQTTSSLIHHNLKAAEPGGMQPLADMPWLAQPVSTVTNVALLAVAVAIGWLRWPQPSGHLANAVRFSLLLSLAVPLQPLGEEYHYVLLLPAVWTALTLASGPVSGVARGLLLVGVTLIALPYPITEPWFEPGARAFLAYPTLYGALLIAGGFGTWLLAQSDLLVQRRSGRPRWRWDILLPWDRVGRSKRPSLVRGE